MDPTNKQPRISADLERKIEEAILRYPSDRKRSAAMPLLHLWQEEFGFINDEGVSWIAARLELWQFDRILGAWWDRLVPRDGNEVVQRSAARYADRVTSLA